MGMRWMGLLVLLPMVAQAGEWEVVSSGAVTVKSRAREGSAIKEVMAEGEMNVDARDLQAAILDAEGYTRFMPYVKESRYLGKAQPDGGGYVYTRLELPFVSSRDYVLKVSVQKRVNPDGSGVFSNSWTAEPDRIPSRSNVTRLRLCEGAWEVTSLGNGKSRVAYRSAVDPGGWVPAFAAESASKKGVLDTFSAMEREAKRRGGERIAQAAAGAEGDSRDRERRAAAGEPGRVGERHSFTGGAASARAGPPRSHFRRSSAPRPRRRARGTPRRAGRPGRRASALRRRAAASAAAAARARRTPARP